MEPTIDKIDITPIPEAISNAKGTFVLYYHRLCGEYHDQSRTECSNETLATELHLTFEKEAEANEYVTAFVVMVLDTQSSDPVVHVHYDNLSSFMLRFPSINLGGYSLNDLERERKRLLG